MSEDTATPLDDRWAVAYRLHAARLRRTAVRIVGEMRADDIVQETFLRAYRNRASFEAERPMGPWLTAIARRTAIDALRRDTAGARAPQAVEQPRPVEEPVEEALFNSIRRDGIEQSFRELSERHQRVLASAELAMDSPGGDEAFRSALARARRAFRQRYNEFARDSGVFGAGSVARTTSSRVRNWAARAQTNTAESITAIAAACAVVLITAGAGTSVAGHAPAHADSDEPATTAAEIGVGSAVPVPMAEFSIRPFLDSHAVVVEGDAHVEPETLGDRPLRADVTWKFGIDEETAVVGVDLTISTPVHRTHAWVGIKVYCDAGIVGSLECQVIETVPLSERHETVDGEMAPE